MRTILLLLLLGCPPALCAGGEAQPQNARETELAAVRDRLSFSLFFRGEVADALIASGVAARYVGLGGVETNSGARSIVMEWIQKNKGAAAELYLNLRSGETAPPENIREHESVWEINPNFLSLIKDLNAAAGGAGVPMEALEAAGRSLYEGPQQTGAVRAALAGDAGPGGAAFFSGYADYRLNKAGLEREVAADGVWLAAARGPDGGAPRGLERPYREALAEYGDFVVAASGVKGRGRITGAESRALESGRARVRAKIASLELSLRAADLAAIEAALRALAGTAGADTLAAAAAGLRASFEAAAAGQQAGAGLGAAERDFSVFYLRYSAYSGFIGLKRASEAGGFSCLYDYAMLKYLAYFFPRSAYPADRAELEGAAAGLDEALLKAAEGNIAGAFSGLPGGPGRIAAAAGRVRRASAFNRSAQFFLWGLLFRPVELNVELKGGHAVFRPEAALFSIMAGKL